MVIVASIYLRFYLEVRVSTFLQTPTPAKIPSDSTTLTLTPQPCSQLLHLLSLCVICCYSFVTGGGQSKDIVTSYHIV
jgi:hypothetical protein